MRGCLLRSWQVIRIWMVPIYLSVALAQLFSLLGAPALAGVAVLILGGWINSLVMKRLHKLRTTQLSATDDRVMQTNEAILGIRIVKMNCWEQPIEVRAPPPTVLSCAESSTSSAQRALSPTAQRRARSLACLGVLRVASGMP